MYETIYQTISMHLPLCEYKEKGIYVNKEIP